MIETLGMIAVLIVSFIVVLLIIGVAVVVTIEYLPDFLNDWDRFKQYLQERRKRKDD